MSKTSPFAVELMVAANQQILDCKSSGLAPCRWRGALCALAVQEAAEPEKGVYPGRAGMDRYLTPVDRPPLSSAASVVQKSVDCVASLCHDDRQPRFPVRSPQLRRGSKNVVSSYHCGENSLTGTQPLVTNLYQVPMAVGMDPVTGLYYERARNYSPSLGSVSRQKPKSGLSAGAAHREISQDPAGYINGANTYRNAKRPLPCQSCLVIERQAPSPAEPVDLTLFRATPPPFLESQGQLRSRFLTKSAGPSPGQFGHYHVRRPIFNPTHAKQADYPRAPENALHFSAILAHTHHILLYFQFKYPYVVIGTPFAMSCILGYRKIPARLEKVNLCRQQFRISGTQLSTP